MSSDWLKPVPPRRSVAGKRRKRELTQDLKPNQPRFDMDDWEPSLLHKLLRAHNKLKR